MCKLKIDQRITSGSSGFGKQPIDIELISCGLIFTFGVYCNKPSCCTVDTGVRVICSQAIQTDDVVDTVNYAEIHEAVKAEMSIPSKLLEHVCGRIAKRLLAEFPAIEEIELRLSKRNPPMGADIDSAGVELHCSR